MSIRIERLDDGFLVVDDRGPMAWRGAAVSLKDAEVMAEHRLNPRLPTPPPNITTGGYDEPIPPLAARQFDQAMGDAACLGGVCSQD